MAEEHKPEKTRMCVSDPDKIHQECLFIKIGIETLFSVKYTFLFLSLLKILSFNSTNIER